jgi:hypothetical protein
MEHHPPIAFAWHKQVEEGKSRTNGGKRLPAKIYFIPESSTMTTVIPPSCLPPLLLGCFLSCFSQVFFDIPSCERPCALRRAQ